MMPHGAAMSKAQVAIVDADGFAPVTTSRRATLPLTRGGTCMMISKQCYVAGRCGRACRERTCVLILLFDSEAVESPNRFGVLPDVHDDFFRDLDTVLDTVDDDMDDSLSLDREVEHARGGGECHTTLV